MRSQQVPNWVWMVLVGAHLLALGWALASGGWFFPDSDRYLQAAENLRRYGELYARPWPGSPPHGQAVQEYTIRTLGYPLILLGLGGTTVKVLGVLVLQNILSLVSLGWVLRWWARRGERSARCWGMALLGVLTFPAQLIYANALMSEVLLQAAVLAIAVAGVRFIRTRQVRYGAMGALALVAGLLLKPVFFPLAGAVAAGAVWLAMRERRPGLALVGAAPWAVVLLYMSWNQHRTGYFHYSSIADINALHYNAAGVVRQLQGPEAEALWVASVLREANAQPNFAARQRTIQRRAGAVVKAHPAVYAWQQLQGMAAFFLDPGRFDISQFMRLRTPPGGGFLAQIRAGGGWRAVSHLPLGLLLVLLVVLLANAARLLLAVRGFWRLRSAEAGLRGGRWVAAGLMLYVALVTGPLGAARFLVPVWPLLLALALEGLPKLPKHAQLTAPAPSCATG